MSVQKNEILIPNLEKTLNNEMHCRHETESAKIKPKSPINKKIF